MDLELLRELFRDVRMHIGIGTVQQLGLAKDRSALRVLVSLLPEARPCVATMSWSAAGANAGFFSFPQLEDLVIVAFSEGHPDDAYVVGRLASLDEQIPEFAASGHMVAYANAGTKLYLGSDTKIGVGRPNVEPTEPMVLGNVLNTFLQNFINAFLNAPQVGQCAVGPVFLDPSVRSNLTSYLSTYLTTASTNILSQIGYVERGV